MSIMNNLIEKYRHKAEQGLGADEAVAELNELGLTITESMVVLVQAFGLSLAEAKTRVSIHPVWSGVVQVAKPLHEELILATRKTGTTTSEKGPE